MRRGLSPLAAGVLLAVPLLGCEGMISASGSSGDAEATTTSALVVVERSVDTASGSGARAQAVARFVRYPASSTADDALHAVGAALDLPVRGACAPIGSSAAGLGADNALPVVELVDVGAVSIEADGVETRLTPRQVPDVTDVVSGIVYTRGGDPTTLPAAVRYTLHVAGRAGVAAFDLGAVAPSEPTDVHFAGELGHGGALTTSGPLEVAWTPDGTTDLVYVDAEPAGIRCTLGDGSGDADVARASIPASALDGQGTLLVHRVRRQALHGAGFEGGEIRFDFARSLPYASH